jgi:hypothetical protein
VSSDVTPLVNALAGYGDNTPGTDYPQQLTGPVANGPLQSQNPNNYMTFNSAVDGVNLSTRTFFTQVLIEDAAAGALDATFSNFTVALWLNPTSTNLDRFAIGKMGGSNNRGWQLAALNGTNDLSIDYFSAISNGTDRSLQVANVLPLNTWTHVAFAFDGAAGTESIYVNGVLQSPVTSTSTLPTVPAVLNGVNSSPFRVGHRGGTSSTVGGWIGGIDDVRVYDETLTAAQVQALLEPPGLPGDFDDDNDVDGDDFAIWQMNFPTASNAMPGDGDGDGDGDVDGADFVVWQTNFSPSSVAPVPEPHSLTLVALGGLFGLLGRSKLKK